MEACPLDIIDVLLYHLCQFYHCDLCGCYEIKSEYNHNKRQPSSLPFLDLILQIGLAQSATSNQRVNGIVGGAWFVMESDGITPRAVKVFRKETCSCSSTRTCYHITACRLMADLSPNIHGQPNISKLQ